MILRNRNCKQLQEALLGLVLTLAGLEAVGVAQQQFAPRQSGNVPQANQSGNGAQQVAPQPNSTQANSTQPNSTQANSGQANSGQANSGQANSGQANSGQPNSGQQVNPAAPANGNAPAAVGNPAAAPFPPLDARLQQYLEQVLAAWEKATSDIERFRCNFTRWEYDPTNGPANTHYTWSRGVLRYMKPDKGLFRVDDILFYKPSADNGQAKYEAIKDRFGDYWVCDGKSIHIYERNEKKVKRYDLPPEMQGVGIYQSPLPFLFGVKSQEVLSRYWIRPIPPENGSQTEVWLEAYPKNQADAANYQKVMVVLDAQEVLPKVLVVFDPNYTPQNPQRTVFEFTDRERNWTFVDRINELNLLKEEFIPAAPPKDWKIEVTPVQGQEAPPPRVANPVPTDANRVR